MMLRYYATGSFIAACGDFSFEKISLYRYMTQFKQCTNSVYLNLKIWPLGKVNSKI
jgi:hypothetical protein